MSRARKDARRRNPPRKPSGKVGLAVAGALILLLAGLAWYGAARRSPGPSDDADPTHSRAHLPAPGSGANSAVPGPEGGAGAEAANLVTRGNELLRQGQFAEAAKVYEEAGRLTPQDEDVHYNLGIAFARLGRQEEAVASYRRALELFPQYAEAHNNLGILLHRMGKLDEAFEHFRAAIKAVPDYASAHNNLGNALRQRGLAAEATDAFLKASRIDTNYWQARFNLANSYVALDRLDDAIAEYEAVLRIEPDFAPAQQALEQTRLKRGSHTP